MVLRDKWSKEAIILEGMYETDYFTGESRWNAVRITSKDNSYIVRKVYGESLDVMSEEEFLAPLINLIKNDVFEAFFANDDADEIDFVQWICKICWWKYAD